MDISRGGRAEGGRKKIKKVKKAKR